MSTSRKRRTAEAVLSEVWPGQSLPLLTALGILSADGTLNADSRRKLKQVLHLIQMLKPPIERLLSENADPVIADLGAGKSYLGLILYDLVLRDRAGGSVISVEAREDLARKAGSIADASGFKRARFLAGTIAESQIEGGADVVTALHACDTATDDAIHFALRHNARVIALVPCCQAEVARQLDGLSHESLSPLWRHSTDRREFASGLTNVIRGLYLEAHGYKVRATELTGWDHSLKNELLLAERHQRSNPRAKAQLDRLLEELPVHPGLLSMAVPQT